MIKETKSVPKSKSLNDAGNSGRTKAAGVTLDTGHASGVKGAAAASRMTGNTAAVRPAGMTGNLTGGRPAGGVGMGASTAGGVGATAPNTVTGGAGLSAHGAKTAAGVGATAHSPGKAGEVGVKSHKTGLAAGVGAAAKTKEDTKRFISPEELKESMPQFLQNAKKRTKQEESKDYDFEEHLPDDGQEEKGQDDDLEIIDLDDL